MAHVQCRMALPCLWGWLPFVPPLLSPFLLSCKTAVVGALGAVAAPLPGVPLVVRVSLMSWPSGWEHLSSMREGSVCAFRAPCVAGAFLLCCGSRGSGLSTEFPALAFSVCLWHLRWRFPGGLGATGVLLAPVSSSGTAVVEPLGLPPSSFFVNIACTPSWVTIWRFVDGRLAELAPVEGESLFSAKVCVRDFAPSLPSDTPSRRSSPLDSPLME